MSMLQATARQQLAATAAALQHAEKHHHSRLKELQKRYAKEATNLLQFSSDRSAIAWQQTPCFIQSYTTPANNVPNEGYHHKKLPSRNQRPPSLCFLHCSKTGTFWQAYCPSYRFLQTCHQFRWGLADQSLLKSQRPYMPASTCTSDHPRTVYSDMHFTSQAQG